MKKTLNGLERELVELSNLITKYYNRLAKCKVSRFQILPDLETKQGLDVWFELVAWKVFLQANFQKFITDEQIDLREVS